MKLGLLLTALALTGCGGTEAPKEEVEPAHPAEVAPTDEAKGAAPELQAEADCDAAVTNHAALTTGGGQGAMSADARTAMIEECRTTWTAQRVACERAASSWEQASACQAPPAP